MEVILVTLHQLQALVLAVVAVVELVRVVMVGQTVMLEQTEL
jgi:hypothetical protein